MRGRCLKWLTLGLVLALPVAAQTTGRIDGRVVDAADGSSLPGVTITITSTDLQGQRSTVSDADGQFRFLGLPPGTYTVKALLDTYSPLEQSDIRVSLDHAVTLELTLQGGVAETITVSGSPIIDTSTTTIGSVFSEQVFEEIPTTRTYEGLAFQTPGVVTGGLGDNPSMQGASAAENRYIIDGIDTTDPAFGTIGSTVTFEFVKEVEVKTGGYEAEYGGALGGVVNVITRSGSNDFEGSLFGYWSDDNMSEEKPPTRAFGSDVGFTEYDFGAALGGKLIADKLWYFVAANPNRTEEDYTTRTELANSEVVDTSYFAGKLTWQLDPNHQIVASLFGDSTDIEDNLVRNSVGIVGDDRDQGATNYGLTYNGTASSSLFLEVAAGKSDQDFETTPFRPDSPTYEVRDVARLPLALAQGCPGDTSTLDDTFPRFNPFSFNTGCLGGTFHQENGDSSRDDLRGAVTWFGRTGSVEHEIKVGSSYRRVEYEDFSHYPGPAPGPFFDSRGGSEDNHGVFLPGVPVDAGGLAGQRWQLFHLNFGTARPVARLVEYDQGSVGETDEAAVFLQDRVSLGDYFSLNLGVRADQFEAKGDLSDSVAGRELDFSFSDAVAPRVGFTWDVARNGRSKLYGHFGRFYESVPLDINARAFGNEKFNFYYFYYPEDGSGNPQLPNAANPGTHFYTYRLGGGTLVDPNLEAMYTQEWLAGFDYEVRPNLAIGVRYTDRSIENVIEDVSLDGGQHYFITNPGGVFTVEPVTGTPLATPVNFPEATREYRSAEVFLNKRFSDNWQFFASYVNSENEGNYGGLFRQDNGQLDPNITSLFDLPDLLLGATGRLPNDREHQVKAYGSYAWSFGLVTGFYGQFLSGTPISQLGAHRIYGRRERFVTPRGSFGTTPDVWNLDLHGEYPLRLGGNLELKLIADVFNVTDQSEVTAVDQEWTFATRDNPATPVNELTCGGTQPACPLGNPFFGEATDHQQPRTIRLGLKLAF